MKIVTNDMVTNTRFKNKYEAIEAVRKSLKMLQKLKNNSMFERLSSNGNVFRNMELSEGYYFEELFAERNELFSRTEKSLLRSLIINFNKIVLGDMVFRYAEMESKQCGWAAVNHCPVFSLSTGGIWEQAYLSGEMCDTKGAEVISVNVVNVANEEHLLIHKKALGIRVYEFNPKHKISSGWGSDMDLTDTEAQELLLVAVPVDKEERHLVAKKNGKYYSFRSHYENVYHGYHDATMIEKYRRLAESRG